MTIFQDFFLPCLYAFCACLPFCVLLNQRGRLMIYTSLGGALGWAVFLLFSFTGSDIFQFFAGSIAVSVYAEIMARVCKVPATGFLLVGILPFVPGGGIYYTMEYCISGNTELFLSTGIHTFGVAGSVAVGILLVSSLVRMWHNPPRSLGPG